MNKQNLKKPDIYRSKKPLQKRSILTRQKILDASKVLIGDIGFEKTNTNLIAEKAEVSVGTIYAHFKDKWEIFLTILDEFSQDVFNFLSKGIDDILQKEILLDDVIEWLVRGLYEAHKLNGTLNLEIAKFALKDKRADRLRAFWHEKNVSKIIGLLELYSDQLSIVDLEASVIVIHLSAHQVFQYLYKNKGGVDEEAILNEFIAMFKRYFMCDLTPLKQANQ